MKPLLSCWLGIKRKHLEHRVSQTWQVCNYTTHMRKAQKHNSHQSQTPADTPVNIGPLCVCPHSSHREACDLTAPRAIIKEESSPRGFQLKTPVLLYEKPSGEQLNPLSQQRQQCESVFRTNCRRVTTNTWSSFLSTALKAWETDDCARIITSVVRIPHSVSAGRGAGRSLSVGKNVPFFPPLARCTFAAIADIGNEPKWIRSALTTSPFLLHTPRPVSFLPYWAMIGWSHWPQPIINHCRLQVPQVFFFPSPPY